MGRRRSLVAVVGTCALLAAACSERGTEAEPTPSAPSGTTPSPSTPPPPSPSASPGSRPTQPVVLAMHATRSPTEVSEAVARRLVSGQVRSWSALDGADRPLQVVRAPGTPGDARPVADSAAAAIDRVVRDQDVVAVVPATAVGPRVRAIDVAGTDPLTEPTEYPLTMPVAPEAENRVGPPVTLSIVGDIMLGRRVGRIAAEADDPTLQLRPMQDRLAAADITVGNLENTLSRAGAPTQGDDSFAAPPRIRAGLRDAGFDVIGLANNHLGDFGDEALVQTVRRLRAGGFETFGAGRDARQARRPAVVERAGVRFGFVGFNAIGETPKARPSQAGADSVSMPPRTGPLHEDELADFLERVRRLDRHVDVVVVVPHWGTQYTNRPEPVQRQVADRLVEAGADLVVGGHPHWLQGVETIRGRLVVHSLGNFVFDMDFMQETQEGALLELTFWGSRLRGADFVPYRMDGDFAPRVVAGAAGAEILELMWETSGAAWQSGR